MVEVDIQIPSFVCGYTVVPVPFVEKTILSPIECSWYLIDVWVYSWILNYIPLIYMCVLMPAPQCFDYCSFVVSFEIEKYEEFCSFSRFWIFGIPCNYMQGM